MHQQHNPYAAPGASAGEASSSPERLVRIGVGFYVASFLLILPSAVATALEPDLGLDDEARVVVAVSIAVACSLLALFTAFISRGVLRRRQGARWWLAGAAVLPVLDLVWTGPAWAEFAWYNITDTASSVARIAAGVMMFWPGVAQWFAREEEQR